MTTFSLSFFTFRLYYNNIDIDGNKKEVNIDLNNMVFSEKLNYLGATSFNDLLENFSKTYINRYSDKKTDSRIFKVVNSNLIKEKKCNYVFINSKSGKYGTESELVDPKTNKTVYKKPKNIADTKQFRLLFCTPHISCDMGIVVFENISGFGIKNIFEEEFNRYINYLIKTFKKNKGKDCLKIYIKIKNILPMSAINKYFESENLKKIIFIQYSKYIDKSKNNNKNLGIQAETKELTFKKPYNIKDILKNTKNNLKKYNKSLNINFSKKDIKDIVTLENFDFDNIKYELEVNNQKKTIDLENINKVKLSENITNLVKIGKDGYPVEENLISIMKEDGYYYLSELGLIKKGDN